MARYDFVPGTSGGSLNYGATTQRPIRGAVVEILNAANNAVLATTSTDASGAYSTSFASGPSSVIVRLKAQIQRSGGPAWNVRVVDNTNGKALYALDSAPVTVAGTTLTQNLSAASGWGGAGYTGTRAAAPFAILDAVYTAVNYTLTAAATRTWPALEVNWSVNNVPSGNNLPAGQIGTTFYGGAPGGVHQIYVLGAANTDTDEFDQHVIVHEWGHYFQAVASRDDSIGGPHGGTDRLDPRVSFSEGWGNAWSGIALTDPVYKDSAGPNQAGGFAFNVSTAPSSGPIGWFREASAQYLVYTLSSTYGFTPLFDVLNGFVANSNASTTLFSLKAGMKARLPTNAGAIDALFATQGVNGTDEWATGETNDGGVSTTPVGLLPLFKTYGALGSSQQLCLTNQAGTYNKLGNSAFVRFTPPTARGYTLQLTGPTGSDPDFSITRPGVSIEAISAVDGSETATVNLQANEHVIAVTAFGATAPLCLTLTIN